MAHYSTYDPASKTWIVWHSEQSIPTVLAPMDKIRAGKTVMIQEFVTQMPEDARIIGASPLARGHAVLQPAFQYKPATQTACCCDTTKIPFWIKVTGILTLIRLGVAWAEWSHHEEQREHWALLEEINQRMLPA